MIPNIKRTDKKQETNCKLIVYLAKPENAPKIQEVRNFQFHVEISETPKGQDAEHVTLNLQG